MDNELIFSKFGLAIPDILLPAKHVDLQKWAAIACDQFTQDREYWQKAESYVGEAPSTLHLFLPEVYLEGADNTERLNTIHQNMQKYTTDGTFASPIHSFIYIERKTAYNRTRKGLIAAIDLDQYEWKPFSNSLIRATEGTIVDRLPPRIKIRQKATLDMPHIMLLINDPDKAVVEATGDFIKSKKEPLYDTDLMCNSGHITAWAVEDREALEQVYNALSKTAQHNTYNTQSGIASTPFLFAAGDGNHSLATAKAVWDEYKKNNPTETEHPLRYALTEIVNIFDDGLTFEPIHRVLFNAHIPLFIKYMTAELNSNTIELSTAEELTQAVVSSDGSFGLVYIDDEEKQHYVLFEAECSDLLVSYFQPILDAYMSFISETTVDFIHGTEEVFKLGAQKNTAGILLPPIEKDNFFATIYACGILPRKSFSMGEASEKRFYMEARSICY